MANNNGNNRRNSGYTSNDNFNWEEFDMVSSGHEPVPRRRRQNVKVRRRTRLIIRRLADAVPAVLVNERKNSSQKNSSVPENA